MSSSVCGTAERPFQFPPRATPVHAYSHPCHTGGTLPHNPPLQSPPPHLQTSPLILKSLNLAECVLALSRPAAAGPLSGSTKSQPCGGNVRVTPVIRFMAFETDVTCGGMATWKVLVQHTRHRAQSRMSLGLLRTPLRPSLCFKWHFYVRHLHQALKLIVNLLVR